MKRIERQVFLCLLRLAWECKEARFRGPTLRTEHRDTEHVSRGDWVFVRYLSKSPVSDVQHLHKLSDSMRWYEGAPAPPLSYA